MQTLQMAMDCHRQGRLAEAEQAYRVVLTSDPNQFEALHLFGLLRLQQGNPNEAYTLISKAVGIRPSSLDALSNLSAVLLSLGRHAEALSCCDEILSRKADDANALFNRGVALGQVGRLQEALASYDRALAANPNHFNAMFNRGSLRAKLGRDQEALSDFSRLATLMPGNAEVLNNRGNVEAKLRLYADALTSYDRALAAKPGFVQALTNRSNVLRLLDRPAEALASLDQALAVAPGQVEVLVSRGLLLMQLNRLPEALAAFDQVVGLDRADARVLTSRAHVLLVQHGHEEAMASCDRAIAMDASFADAFFIRGQALKALGRHEDAAVSFERAHALAPDHRLAFCETIMCYLSVCHWDKVDDLVAGVRAQLARGKSILSPFALLGLPITAAEQLQNAQAVVRERLPHGLKQFPNRTADASKRIRLAYLSGDMLIRHPIAHLIPGLIERHDRSRFEVFAVSHGPNDGDPERGKLQAAFDQFFDMQTQSDPEIAALLYNLEVDIVIDLSGYSERGRTYLLAHRPAPIQVAWLGYLGTSGADFIDYVLSDSIVLPFDQQPYFSEKIIHLPDSFMVTNPGRIVARIPERAEAGLPPAGFVFCSFNESYKITAPVFGIWMRLLQRVDGSVLWLMRSNEAVVTRLRREAERQGVDPGRLVFAPKLPPAEHLARIGLADLFLDTRPVNAGATAIDALLMGLPVLTCTGDTFASRVASSILLAAGQPELVTGSAEDYEARALELATDSHLLHSIRNKLTNDRSSNRLFDIDRFRRHLEAAFSNIQDRRLRGDAPQGFQVEAID